MKTHTLAIALLFSIMGATSCSSKDDEAPSYSSFTPIAGTFAIAKNGAASYNLTDLKLKVTHNASTNLDVYEFRGIYNGVDGVSAAFYLDPKRTGSGPFSTTSLAAYYTGGFSGAQTIVDASTSASLSTANNKFTGSFTGPKLSGKLTQ